MVKVNLEQAKFYDSIQSVRSATGRGGYAANPRANLHTRAWARLRSRQYAAISQAGVTARVKAMYDRWMASKAGGVFLEVGCFSGGPSTFRLAQAAGKYVGIDLSALAVRDLNEKFTTANLAHKASAQAVDFLTMSSEQTFDLIHASGVLHHFEAPEPLFAKLAELLNPGGVLLFNEPSAVNLFYRALRACYRLLQSDAAWEWPFRHRTIDALERHFIVVEGFGCGRWSLPFSVLTGVPVVGRLVTGWYVRLVRSEVEQGWHSKVWSNSIVTAVCRVREARGPDVEGGLVFPSQRVARQPGAGTALPTPNQGPAK